MKRSGLFLIAISVFLFLSTRENFSQSDNIKPLVSKSSKKTVCAYSDEQRAENRISTAESLFNKAKYKKALSELRCVLLNDPLNSDAYFLLGKINYRRKNLKSALTSFKTALFWKEDFIEAQIALGEIYLKKGDCLRAKSYLQSALKIDSNNKEAITLQPRVKQCNK